MADCEIVHYESDTLVLLKHLRNKLTQVLVSAATVTAQVLDSDGAPVAGVPDPITLDPVAGQAGAYSGVIPDTASLSVGDEVTVKIVADNGAGQKRTFTIEAQVKSQP